jgi:hypothetical protein
VIDQGWIVTLAAPGKAAPQISIASEGGSGAAVPDLSIEVGDLDEALRRVRTFGLIAAKRAINPLGRHINSFIGRLIRSSAFRFVAVALCLSAGEKAILAQ